MEWLVGAGVAVLACMLGSWIGIRARDAWRREKDELVSSLERYRILFDRSPRPIYVFDLETLAFIEVNQAALQHYGYSREEFLSLTADAIRPPEEMSLLLDRIHSGIQTPAMTRHRKKDGSLIDVEVSVYHLTIQDRGAVLVSVNDVTEKRRAEDNLQQAHASLEHSVRQLEKRESDLRDLVSLGEMLQSCYSADEACAIVSDAMGQIFPYYTGALYAFKPSRDGVERCASWGEGTTDGVFHPNDCWGLRRGDIHVVEHGRGARCKHASVDAPATLCIPMIAQSDTIGILHLVPGAAAAHPETIPVPVQNVAKAAADQIALALSNIRFRDVLKSQSIRDPLTNLFNRRYMEESLERELHRATRTGVPVAIVIIDLDHFKRFNDTYGHRTADRMLATFANHLQRSVRLDDIVCRYGGEEFVLILPGTGLPEAAARLEQTKADARALTLETGFETSGPLTFSGGIAIFPHHGLDAETLLAAADRALYDAKSGGRNRLVIAGGKTAKGAANETMDT